MDTVDVNNMGIIDGSGVFRTHMITGTQPLIYAQDANTSGDDLTVYGNKVFLMQIVQENQPSSVVNGFVLNNSQIPVVGPQLFLPQDSFISDVDESKLITFNTSCSNISSVISEEEIEKVKEVDSLSTDHEEPTGIIVDETENVNSENNRTVDPKFCVPCGLLFDTVKLFKKHNRIHLSEKPYKCQFCDESFNYELNLSLHIAIHNVDNPYCPICKKRFNRVAGLKAHIMLHEKEETIFCPECGDEFTSQMSLDEHLNDHKTEFNKAPVKKKQYNCLQCQEKFPTSTLLKEHCKQYHRVLRTKKFKRKRRNAYVCTNCEKAFDKPSQLDRHYRIHTGERPFQCELCPRAFNQKGSLQIHMLKHTGVKPYECKQCHATFSQKGNLQAHVFKLHTVSVEDGRIHKCPKCTCVFGKRRSLRAHMTKVHGIFSKQDVEVSKEAVIENFSVSAVDHSDSSNKENESKVVESSPELNLNENPEEDVTEDDVQIAEEKVTKWHHCSYCSKEFKRASDLIRHTKLHNRDQPYKCKLCCRTFSASATLAVHMKTHTGLKCYLCDICDKLFATSNSLKVHKRIHLTENQSSEVPIPGDTPVEEVEDGNNITCTTATDTDTVEQALSNVADALNTLNNKIVNQSEEVQKKNDSETNNTIETEKQLEKDDKPFKCPECRSSFKRQVHLKMHYRMHTGEKPFKCNICSNDFSTKAALKTHMLKHKNINIKHFKCEECDKNFLLQSSLKRHIESAHMTQNSYRCPICQFVYQSYTACQKHLTSHELEEGIKLKPIKVTENNQTPTTNDENNINNATAASTAQINNIISSLNQGQQITISQNEDGIISLTTISSDHQADTTLASSTELSADPPAAVFTIKGGAAQLLNSLEKATLYDQNFDGCLFLQNDGLEISGPILYTNLATNLEQSTTDRHGCDICSAQFQSLTELNDHRAIHLSEKAQQADIICDLCEKTFQTTGDYEEHIKIHLDKFIHNCAVCNLSFSSEEALNIHYTTHLKDDSNADNLEEDKLEKHNVILIPSRKNINKPAGKNVGYVMKPSGILFNKDDQKLSSSLLKSILKNDKKKKEVKGWDHYNKCIYCPKSFRKPSDLARHLRIHTGERPYVCPTCNKSFSVKSTADCHLKTHTKDRSYRCQVCSKTFATSGSLKVHHRLHTGAKPHQCPICEAKFRTSGHKLTHIKSHFKHLNQKGSKKITIPINTTNVPEENAAIIVDHSLVNDNIVREEVQNVNLDDEHDPTTEFLNNINSIKLSSAANKNNGATEAEDCLLADFDQGKFTTEHSTPQYIIQAVTDANGIEPTTYVVSLEQGPALQSTSNDPKINILQDIDCLNKKNGGTVLVTTPLLDDPQSMQVDCNDSENFECTFCKQQFQSESGLSVHLQKDHQNDLYHCLVCPEKFTTKTALEVHTVVHSLEQVWKCSACSETFNDEEQLRCHKCTDNDAVVKSSSLDNSPSFDLNSVVTDFFLFPSE